MRRTSGLLICVAACGSLAFGQDSGLKGYTTALPVKTVTPNGASAGLSLSSNPLPLWNYSVVAGAGLGGGTWTGTMVGRSPASRAKTTTTIPTQIIPLIITITNAGSSPTTYTYDPTVVDACVGGGHTGTEIITSSPIFTNNTWVMNGVNVGNTQYIDAFQRAEFWSQVQGTPYHLILQPSVLPPQVLTFNTALGHTGGSSGPGANFSGFGTCPGAPLGVVNIDDLDNALQALITGPLASMVNTGTFPIFLTRNVVSSDPGVSLANCCILGYHSGLISGGNLQIYSPFSLDTAGVFGPGFVTTLSHEMAEAVNDPNGVNPTPVWGNIGQVLGGCQNNLEVGDPLSEGFGTPTTPFIVPGGNGLTYQLQELAFFNWFFGSPTGPVGTGGKFSNNGSFGGAAKPCPPGGSN